VLDIGCGSGIYLRHILDTARDASGVGIDLDAEAVAQAEDNLVELRLEGRCRVEQGNIEARARALGEFDLVLLLNNVYYWAPTERVEILKTLRQCVAPAGTLVVATALPDGQAFNRHLDMILRVTQNSHRLPTRDELRDDLRHAGFEHITLTEPIPRSGLAVAIAR
jgi:SAM-dependent methyltransferase